MKPLGNYIVVLLAQLVNIPSVLHGDNRDIDLQITFIITEQGILFYHRAYIFKQLFVQHFKRPELCVRGMVFAFNADYARQVKIRTDIRRGEDGSLALSLKPFGKIDFLYNRDARPVTGYGTIGSQSLWQSFIQHVKIQGKGITRIFFKKDHYEDSEDNLVKNK